MSELNNSGTTFYKTEPINESSSTFKSSGTEIYRNGPISGGGSGVQIRYEAVINICDNMISIAKDLNDQWDIIKSIINSRDEYWRGEAADRFFEDIQTSYNAVSEITSDSQMLKYISKVKELVEENKKTDTVISESEITKITDMMPTFRFLTVGTVSRGLNNELFNSAQTNSNIGSETIGTVSDGTDNELYESVGTNSNVGSETIGTVSDGTDNELYESVGADDKVSFASDAGEVSGGINDDLMNSVDSDDKINSETDIGELSNGTDDILLNNVGTENDLDSMVASVSQDASTLSDSLTGSINSIDSESNK